MPDEAEKTNYEVERVDDINTYLDPRLQRTLLRYRRRIRPRAGVASPESEETPLIEVIGRVGDLNAEVPGLNVRTIAGDIVTGTVRADEIEAVRSKLGSLKEARPVGPALKVSVPEINGNQARITAELPAGSSAVDGKDVIVGIIDYGCDFVHPNFRHPNGRTRLLYFWDQSQTNAIHNPPANFHYGSEFNSDAINNALQTADPYAALSHDPGDGAHGTHVMDIAAGNGRIGGSGVAPGADLIFVHSYSNDYEDKDNLGNSARLLEAVHYIFDKAQSLHKQAVINLSVGTNGGPHDGTNLVELGIDNLLQTRGRAVVIASNNVWENKIHASGRIPVGERRVLEWELPLLDQTDNEVEIWYRGNTELRLMLVDPTGTQIGPFPLGTTNLLKSQGVQLGAVFHRNNDPNNHDNQIDILLSRESRAGSWSIVLETIGPNPAEFHAWIERDDEHSSQFSDADNDPRFTISSIACGQETIVVGSYDATDQARTISSFSAEGPTRDGRRKPEISAPGQGVFAARSRTSETVAKSGTSMASPHVAGLIALLMQVAGPLTVDEIRAAVLNFARRDPPQGNQWQSRYGLGRIDVATSIRSLLGVPTH
jgi:subtilisin family serine protease